MIYMKNQEEQLSAHIRALLGDYVQKHLATDYAEFTRLAVSELLYTEKVPLHDPQSLILPVDPFDAFSSKHKLEDLEPYAERLAITKEDQAFLKNKLQLPKGKPRSERLNLACLTASEDNDDFERLVPLVSRTARKETPQLGSQMKKAENGYSVYKLPQTEAKTSIDFILDKFETVPNGPIEEQPVNGDKVLDVLFQMKAEEHEEVRSLLASVSVMRGPPKKSTMPKKIDQQRSYLPARLQQLPPQPRSPTPPPDSPPLMPLFPRNQVMQDKGKGTVKRKSGVLDGLPVVPESIHDLPAMLGAPQSKERKIFPDDDEYSTEEMYKQNMLIVDGWTTLATSSPSPLPSLAGDEDNIDQLLEMFPSSPDTEVSAFMNFAEEVETSKLDPILIPRSRCIGGNLSTEPKESGTSLPTDINSFLSSLLDPTQDEAALEKHHPLLSRRLLPTPAPAASLKPTEEPQIRAQGVETASVLGQPAFSIAGTCVEGFLDEDEEIRGIYAPKAFANHDDIGSPSLCIDPLDLIRNEVLFDEDMQVDQPKGKQSEGILHMELIPVPLLPEPICNIRDQMPKSLAEMLAPPSDVAASATGPGHLKFLKKVKGLAPLRISLSWVPFTVTNPPPAHAQLLDIDSVYDKDMPEANFRPAVDALLLSVPGPNGRAADAQDAEDQILRKLRNMSLKEEPDIHPKNEFSAEVARCELLMTRSDRWRLHGLKTGAGDSDEIGQVNQDVKILPSSSNYNCRDEITRPPGNAGKPSISSETSFHPNIPLSSIGMPDCIQRYRQYIPKDAVRRTEDLQCHDGNRDHDQELPVSQLKLAGRDGSSSDIPDSMLNVMSLPDSLNPNLAKAREPELEQELDLERESAFGAAPGDQAEYHYAAADMEEDEFDDTMVDPNHGISSSTIATDTQDMNYILQDQPGDEDEGMAIGGYGYEDAGPDGRPAYEDRTDYADIKDRFQHVPYQDYVTENPTMDQPMGTTRYQSNQSPQSRKRKRSTLNDDSRALNSTNVGKRSPISTDQKTRSPIPTNYLTSQANHASSLEMFTKLRAKIITSTAVAQPHESPDATNSPMQATEPVEDPAPPPSRSCPDELITPTTLQLPELRNVPSHKHKYISSLDLLQKRSLVKALQGAECKIDLVERETLTGVDLIIDPYTAIIFAPLLSLPAQAKDLVVKLSSETWRYSRILIIFEAYPSSRSFKTSASYGFADDAQGHAQPEVYAYTPPILKGVKKFRRDLGIAEACSSKSPQCEVWYAFADTVGEAAAYARLFGNYAEESDVTEGAIWGEREWLDMEPAEEEASLALFNGMNHFSASIMLCQASFDQVLDCTPEERIDYFAPYVGVNTMELLNEEIRLRLSGVEDEVRVANDYESLM